MFRFKQFTVRQDKSPMKVGTDGVLIGSWADVLPSDKYMLDIGCGTGLIALMLAQRSDAMIDAVEIDHASAEQASENVRCSTWGQRINIHEVDVCEFNACFKYDLIVSNPPYFVNSLLSPDQRRSNARHTAMLSFDNLVSVVEKYLSADGRFALILPLRESEIFEDQMRERLYVRRRCLVKNNTENSVVKRVMSEYGFAKPDNIDNSELAIREIGSNEYTDEYKSLTADFYLKF